MANKITIVKFLTEFHFPRRFVHKNLENINIPNKDKYKECLLSGDSLYIMGDVGTGKTHLAIGLAIEFYRNKFRRDNLNHMRNDIRIIFEPATELFLKLKNSFNGADSEIEILNRLDSADLLILDDIGTDKVSDWSRQIIYTIVDRRYRNMKQLIITSNLSLDEFATRYDDRIASRIVEMGKVINLKGEDKRKSSKL